MNADSSYIFQVERLKSMGKNKQGQENEKRAAKAVWNKEMVNIFWDICIQAFHMGMRPGTHLNREGWNYVIKHFEKESGHHFSRIQLKNKWDGTKKDWKTWKALIAEETQLGWDSKKQTLDASDAWWDEKIKAMPAAKKFRHAGIEPELCAKYDVIFMDSATAGNCNWPHSVANVSNDKDASKNNDIGNDELPSINAVSLEGSDNSRNEPNFVESMEQMMMDGANLSSAMIDGANVSSDLPTQHAQATLDQTAVEFGEQQRNERKQKRIDESDEHIDTGKKIKPGTGELEGLAKLSRQINRLMATVESRSSVTSKRTDLPGCSIREVLADLHSIPEIVKGSDLHLFATDLFLSRAKREVYISLGESHVKLTWLKYQHAKSKVDI